jgi:predicted DNA-binding protein (UPF0278 family)
MRDNPDIGRGGDFHRARLNRAVQIAEEQLAEAKRVHEREFGKEGSEELLAAIFNAIAVNYASIPCRLP